MVNISTYFGIAGLGGVITGVTGYMLHNTLQRRVRDSPVYKEAMKMCNNHPAVTTMLGKPVCSRRIDLGNKNNVLSLRMTTLELPVYGSKNDGLLYVWANRQTDQDEWDIVRMDLEILDKMGGTLSIVDKKIVPSVHVTNNELGQNKDVTDSKGVPTNDVTNSKKVPNKDAVDSKVVQSKDATDNKIVPNKNDTTNEVASNKES